MDVFTMIVAIVAITAGGKAIKDMAKLRQGSQDQRSEFAERVDLLEERVRTLEQIITDKRSRLKDEIDSL